MIGNIVDQNKSLSEAGKTPKDTSSRNADSQKYSAKISSSKMTNKQVLAESRGQASKQTKKVPRGSLEGYHASSSTILQFKNVGYDSKKNQIARFSDKHISNNSHSFSNKSFTSNNKYSIMNNYSSITSENSSSDRLSNIIRNNSLF
jgi:hypothetical protein